MPNISGSFGHAIGGAMPINTTMPALGVQGSPLNQMSPSAPGFNPQLVPNEPVQRPFNGVPPVLPQHLASPGGVPTPQGLPQGMAPGAGIPQGDPQEGLIIEALTKQLERLDKRKKFVSGQP